MAHQIAGLVMETNKKGLVTEIKINTTKFPDKEFLESIIDHLTDMADLRLIEESKERNEFVSWDEYKPKIEKKYGKI